MYRTKTRILALLVLLAPAACAQQGAVSGPLTGLVFDPAARAIRPILGIPGAALLGDPAIAADGLTTAYVSPRQDSALLATGEGARFVRLQGTVATPLACDGLTASPERVEYSPSGTAAALYRGGRVQLISGLPDAPVVAGEVNLNFALRGASRFNRRGAPPETGSFAISDDGRFVLAAASRSIQLAGLAGESFSLMPSAAGAAVAFAPGGHDAAVADPANSGIVWLRDVAGAAQKRQLAGPDANAGTAAGISFSGDGRNLYVASARQVAAFDLGTGERTAIVCDCEPAGLYPMGGLFRLNEAGAAPLWLLDARSGKPRVFFVPVRSE
jgi:hypothetical protein